jgi:alpha-L-rhamnosidase
MVPPLFLPLNAGGARRSSPGAADHDQTLTGVIVHAYRRVFMRPLVLVALLLVPPAPALNHAPSMPASLTVGDRRAPLAVEGTPLFGWEPRDWDPGEIQTAYRIIVYRNDRTVWDSGRVTSRDTASVRYGGPALTPGGSYRWSVRTWDRAGAPSPWAADTFGAGIGDAQWQASWIRRTTAESDDYTQARREFTPRRSPIVRARLYVSASQQYRAYLNGREVDRGQGFAYDDEGYYQVSDVTGQLRPGRQAALGVLYHWYGPGQGRPASSPGTIARLEITYADGSSQAVVTDASWRVSRGPWLAASYRNGDGRDYIENVDGRLVSGAWTRPGFDDSGWAVPAIAPARHLVAQQTRLALEVAKPVSVKALPSGAVVADFGTVIPAMPRVRFRNGVPGVKVSMVAGYRLNPDGTVSTGAADNQSTDLSYSYLQRAGDQTFEAFTYEGFRYLQISQPAEIAAVVQHTDAPHRATFASSDPTLDKVGELMRRSALYSAQEQFLDTPTREKGQFLADSVNISQALVTGSGDRAFTAKALREFAASQQRYWPDGRLNAVYPNGDGKRDIPDFTELYPRWAWDFYLASGNRSLLAETYETSARIADYVRAYRDPATGLITNLEGGSGAYQYGIIDWPDRYGYDTTAAARTTVNILAYDALRSTALQARALGRPDTYTSDADDLKTAINSRLRRADGIYHDGLLPDGTASPHASQIANAYALAFDVTPRAQPVADYVASLALRMGPMTAHLLLEGLHRAGRDDQVLARLTDATSLGWANILTRGATFTWETWNADTDGQSQSHGWGAAALRQQTESLLGLTVTAPAARTLRIEPPRGTALTDARGSVWTQAGRVRIAWTRHSLTADIPVNVTAELRLPTGEVRTVGSGGVTVRF